VHGVETILFLVALGTVVAAFAGRLRVPAPSLLVIAGLIVGLLPRFPPVHVSPDVVSLVVLPPLLYAALHVDVDLVAASHDAAARYPGVTVHPGGLRSVRGRTSPPDRYRSGTPAVTAASGFPVLSVLPGQFLLKDLVLVSASLWTLGDSLGAAWPRRGAHGGGEPG
jgi:hypothetical protein